MEAEDVHQSLLDDSEIIIYGMDRIIEIIESRSMDTDDVCEAFELISSLSSRLNMIGIKFGLFVGAGAKKDDVEKTGFSAIDDVERKQH